MHAEIVERSASIDTSKNEFLLLLSEQIRVVIENDGKQHYAEDNKMSPRLYLDIGAEDRHLKLVGYEVYRFGGYELSSVSKIGEIESFLAKLVERHDLVKDAI